jgi:hypothetical protein
MGNGKRGMADKGDIGNAWKRDGGAVAGRARHDSWSEDAGGGGSVVLMEPAGNFRDSVKV